MVLCEPTPFSDVRIFRILRYILSGCPPGQQRTGFFGLGPCVKCEVGSFKPDPGMGRCQPCDPSTPFSSDDRMRCKLAEKQTGSGIL